jgi:hypothetical protein
MTAAAAASAGVAAIRPWTGDPLVSIVHRRPGLGAITTALAETTRE